MVEKLVGSLVEVDIPLVLSISILTAKVELKEMIDRLTKKHTILQPIAQPVPAKVSVL